jgi:O-6-methylguanine DNA methyltransferase
MIDIYVRETDGLWVGLAFTGENIVATSLSYDKEKTLKSLIASLPPNANYQIAQEASDFDEKTIQASKEVHLGGQPFTDFSLAAEYVQEPLSKVLKIAASIPIGYVASYGSIAKAAGTEPKTVGKIMASNPLYPIVQCHRVVGTDFTLVGYGGRKNQQALKAKLARLIKERRGFQSPKEVSANGVRLRVHPVEYVTEKAEKQGLSLGDRRQRAITSY